MKVTKKQEISLCDNCEKAEKWGLNHLNKCASCRKEYCYDCWEKLGEEFNMGVSFSGHGDIRVCHPCIIKPSKEVIPLLQAYQRIRALRQEAKTMWEDFEKRKKEAEAKAKEIYEKMEKTLK